MLIYVDDSHISYDDRCKISKYVISFDNGNKNPPVKIFHTSIDKENKVLNLLNNV